MKIVVKKVGQIGQVVEVENTLETYQSIVGGYIETCPLAKDILIVCNEEGESMDLELNIAIHRKVDGRFEMINGDCAIVKCGEDDFEGLEDEHLEFLRNLKLID